MATIISLAFFPFEFSDSPSSSVFFAALDSDGLVVIETLPSLRPSFSNSWRSREDVISSFEFVDSCVFEDTSKYDISPVNCKLIMAAVPVADRTQTSSLKMRSEISDLQLLIGVT